MAKDEPAEPWDAPEEGSMEAADAEAVEEPAEDEQYADEYGIEGPEPMSPRRLQATVLMIVAAAVFVFSLVVLAAFMGDSADFRGVFDFWTFTTWIWVLFGVLIAIFVWMIILLFTTPPVTEEDWYVGEEPAEIPVAKPAPLGAPESITLRCPRCANVFSLEDPLARPFYHDCPHCQVRGVYTGKDDPPEVRRRLEAAGQGVGA